MKKLICKTVVVGLMFVSTGLCIMGNETLLSECSRAMVVVPDDEVLRGYANGSAQSDDSPSKKATRGTSYRGHYFAVYVKGGSGETLKAHSGSNGQAVLATVDTNLSHYHACGGSPM